VCCSCNPSDFLPRPSALTSLLPLHTKELKSSSKTIDQVLSAKLAMPESTFKNPMSNTADASRASNWVQGAQRNNTNEPPTVAEKLLFESPSTEIPGFSSIIMERLARQVEYYFSEVNLEKDTYVATLRSLNDGYVPLSIISNFGKVKMLVPYDSLNAVRRAVVDCSELLEIVHVDAQTGKRVDDGIHRSRVATTTIQAVGPKTGRPIPMNLIQAAHVSPSVPNPLTVAPVQNTVIIREVPEGTNETHIRNLFSFEKCPPIQSMHLDIANCW
jgi:La domain